MIASRVVRPFLWGAVIVPFAFSEFAFAQQRQAAEANVTVRERPRPQYDALGIRTGSFLVFPEVTFTGSYSDNIDFDEDDEESDYIATVRPSVELESDWSRHALGVELGSELAFHGSETDDDYQDFFLNGDGRFDISRQTILSGNAGVNRTHENQSVGNNDEVEDFTAVDGGLALSHQFNRLTLRLGGDVERTVLDDDDQEDEDRYEYNVLLRGTYEVSPRLNVFAEGRYNVENYDIADLATGDDQDSDGYEARLGAGLNLTSVLFGEAFAGYRVQRFDEGGFDNEKGISFGIDVNWNVTQLTSIGLTGARDFQASDQPGAASNFQTQLGLSIDHELLRNVIVGGSFTYENDDFRNDDREDDIYRLGAGATYWINRNVTINADYEYSERESNQADTDFEANEISIGLTLRL